MKLDHLTMTNDHDHDRLNGDRELNGFSLDERLVILKPLSSTSIGEWSGSQVMVPRSRVLSVSENQEKENSYGANLTSYM